MGNEFSLSPDADITLSADEREIGGLGIFLIRQIMNEVKFERVEGKNVLTLLKRLSEINTYISGRIIY